MAKRIKQQIERTVGLDVGDRWSRVCAVDQASGEILEEGRVRASAEALRRRSYDRQIEQLARGRYPETALLRQVDGVGPITALAFVLKVEEPQRFGRSRTLGPYLGLVPRRDQSGQRDPQLRITRQGDPFVRRLLIQCSRYILGPFGQDSALRRSGLRSPSAGGRTPRSAPPWRWPESSPFCSITSGRPLRSTTRCTASPRSMTGPPESHPHTAPPRP